MKLTRITIAMMVVIPALIASIARAQAPWTWSVTHTNGFDLHGVVYAAGQFVAVGDSGVVLTSPNGVEWTRRTVSSFEDIKGIAYDGTKFVIGGDNTPGTVAYSSDGVNWNSHSGPTYLLRMAFGSNPGVFVGVGTTGKAARSTDGLNWQDVPAISTRPFRDAAFVGGQFYIVNDNGATYRSTDGLSFTLNNFNQNQTWIVRGVAPGGAIAYANERFVAVRRNVALVSADGLNPISGGVNSVASGAELIGITFAAGNFVTVGDNGFIASSTTGIGWTTRRQLNSGSRLVDIAYGTNGVLVAVGNNETIITCAPEGLPPLILHSPTNVVVARGRSTTMSVITFKSLPESYQWFFNGELLPGQTSTNLVIATVQPPQAGQYSVLVSNALGLVSLTNIVSVRETVKHAGMTITSAAPSNVRLEYRDSLQPPEPWQNLADVFVGTIPALYIDTQPVTAHPSRFYRGYAIGGSASWLKIRLYNELLLTGLPGLIYRIEFDDTPGTPGPWTMALDLYAPTSEMAWTDLQSGDHPQRVYRITILP